MVQEQFEKKLLYIIRCMEIEGYDAENQIIAYAMTGEESYITRRGEARTLIRQLDIEQLREHYGLKRRKKKANCD